MLVIKEKTQVIKDLKTIDGAIRQLESRRVMQQDALRVQWSVTQSELNPMNILKDEIRETVSNPKFGSQLLKGVISVASGFVTKKLIVGDSKSSFKKMIGTIAQTGATGALYKNSEEIKVKGASALSSFLKKLKL